MIDRLIMVLDWTGLCRLYGLFAMCRDGLMDEEGGRGIRVVTILGL
jgi:hypothetical protein